MKIKKQLTSLATRSTRHQILHLLCGALFVGGLFVACSKEATEPQDGELGEVPISLTTAISSAAQGGTKAPVVDGATKASLTGIHFLRKDSIAAPKTFAGISPLVASRDKEGLITFASSAPLYNKNNVDAWFVAYYPGEGSTPDVDKVSWTIDGKTDILVAPLWGAGNFIQPRSTGMTFEHQLAQLEVVCKATSDASTTISALRTLWGNITKIEIVNNYSTATYDYATQTTSFDNQRDLELLNPGYTTAFTAMAIPDKTSTAVTAVGMFAPQKGSIVLKITTATMGVVTLPIQLQKDGKNVDFESGKRHRVTIEFEKTQMLVSLYCEVTDWTTGYQTDGEIEMPLIPPPSSGVLDFNYSALIKSGSMNGTQADLTSTTTSYNGYTYNASNADNNGGYKATVDVAFTEPVYYKLEVAKTDESSSCGWVDAWALCKAKTPAGEWRLPRLSELTLMYLNKNELAKTSGFTAITLDYYWSSTESSTRNSRSLNFYASNSASGDKTLTNRVRCVREM